jgi:mitochondrial ATPase complex subunit ATP10
MGKVSVVSLFSSAWAEAQVKSFASQEHHPALMALLEEQKDRCQLVRINYEDNSAKAFLIKLFMGRLRSQIGEANWDKYFVVRKGITDEIREHIGYLNSRVGYTYLLDSECKIRWAGSGSCEPGEREVLLQGVWRLLNEEQTSAPNKKQTTTPKKKEEKAAAVSAS